MKYNLMCGSDKFFSDIEDIVMLEDTSYEFIVNVSDVDTPTELIEISVDYDPLTIEDSIIEFNSAYSGGGISSCDSEDFIVRNTDIDLGPIDPERTDLTIDLGFLPSV